MIQSLLGMMNRYRGGTIEKNQSANVDAIAAMLARQGVNTLRNQPTDNVLFLPVSDKEAIAVRLQSCSLQKGMLTLTTTPLNCEQRQKIQQRIGAGTTE